MALSPSLVVLSNDLRAAVVQLYDANGNPIVLFDSSRPANAAATSVPSLATSTTLLVANPARRRVTIWNNSSKTLFVVFGATATITSGFPIASQGVYQGPLNDYTGIISGIWTAVNGAAEIQEITT